MNYYLLGGDPEWSQKNGVHCYSDPRWRMPGIYCAAHPRVATYVEGYSYPAAHFKDAFLRRALKWGLDISETECEWQEQWRQPAKWQGLRQKVLDVLPYEVTITPGTSFGPTTFEVSGKPADFLHGFLHGNLVLGQSALERLRTRGIQDLFAAPCVMRSKRKRETYYELQIEHQAELAGSLDSSRQTMRRRLGYPMKCARCGAEWGALPKRVVLKGSTVPENASLFRLKNQPAAVFCTEAFARAATELKLTNLLLVPVKTDGSEKKLGLARVPASRPEVWPCAGTTRPPEPPRKNRVRQRMLPPFPTVADLLGKAPRSPSLAGLAGLVRPCLRFMPNPKADLAPGESRFGGLPDLPKGAGWPGAVGVTLDFLLQINLSDVAHYWLDSPLPKSGLLSFFFDRETCSAGAEPSDSKGWRVVFHNGPTSELVRAQRPESLSDDSLSPSCSLDFVKTDSMPALNSPALASARLSEDDRARYARLLARLRSPRNREVPMNRLLGYPDTIQDDMAVPCAMASAGFDGCLLANPKNPKQRRAIATAEQWILLLQLDSDPRLDLQWGDAGRLYFWIRERDLAARRFERCWAVMQSF